MIEENMRGETFQTKKAYRMGFYFGGLLEIIYKRGGIFQE